MAGRRVLNSSLMESQFLLREHETSVWRLKDFSSGAITLKHDSSLLLLGLREQCMETAVFSTPFTYGPGCMDMEWDMGMVLTHNTAFF